MVADPIDEEEHEDNVLKASVPTQVDLHMEEIDFFSDQEIENFMNEKDVQSDQIWCFFFLEK